MAEVTGQGLDLVRNERTPGFVSLAVDSAHSEGVCLALLNAGIEARIFQRKK